MNECGRDTLRIHAFPCSFLSWKTDHETSVVVRGSLSRQHRVDGQRTVSEDHGTVLANTLWPNGEQRRTCFFSYLTKRMMPDVVDLGLKVYVCGISVYLMS